MANPVPSPQEFGPQAIQQIVAEEAQKRGMTIPQFAASLKQQVGLEAAKVGMTPQQYVQMKQDDSRRQFMKQQQQGGQAPQDPAQRGPLQGQTQQQGQRIPVNGTVEARPEALAVAKFLRAQNLKTRTCILHGRRKDMFKVKRAFRALQSDAYEEARTKDPLLPKIDSDQDARQTLALLPLSMLALHVIKNDSHKGHKYKVPKREKRVKGLWEVKLVEQQEFDPMMYYVWLYEGSQWIPIAWAGVTVVAIFTLVVFPLWPMFMQQGAWYLSVGAMGCVHLVLGLTIVRLTLFCITFFAVPPGVWLFPNLYEDVSFVDSFKPVWGWQETKKKKKR